MGRRCRCRWGSPPTASSSESSSCSRLFGIVTPEISADSSWKRPMPFCVMSTPAAVICSWPREIAHRIGPAPLFRSADGVEIDHGAAAHAAVAHRRQRRLGDSDRDLILYVVPEVRVDLDVGHLRSLRAGGRRRGRARSRPRASRGLGRRCSGLRGVRERVDAAELCLEPVAILLREPGLPGQLGGNADAQGKNDECSKSITHALILRQSPGGKYPVE